MSPHASMRPPHWMSTPRWRLGSPEALDRGEFKVALGPNLGAAAAGRNLGRFADLLGADAREALQRTARAEEATSPEMLWAELTYLPRRHRSGQRGRPASRFADMRWHGA